MSQIVLNNLGKSYGNVSIIKGISLSIHEGEFIVLVGPSGCGKSTLLRMIAGLEDITSGELLMHGEVVNTLPAKKRDIAMVFQSYALYPHMKVRDNMSFALKLASVSKAERMARVEEAAEILGLHLNTVEKYFRDAERSGEVIRHGKCGLFRDYRATIDFDMERFSRQYGKGK